MLYSLLVAFVATATLSLAAPQPDESKGACKDKLVSILDDHGGEARPFCSSYLALPRKKTTVTTTTTITPSPRVVTTTYQLTDFRFTEVPSTVPGDPITYYYNAPYPSNTKTILPTPPAKRDAVPQEAQEDEARWGDKPLPTYCSGYRPPEVSSACSCLSIKPGTKTKTSTVRVTLPATTTTVTKFTTVATVTHTVTSVVTGPRPTVSVCADYENSPLNKGYEYLNQGDVDKLTSLPNEPIYSGNLLECCNLCYETPNCVAYRFNNDHSVATCQRWATPGNLPIIGYNEQCRAGLVNGTRQPITETDMFGNQRHAIAIGPCLAADWLN